MTHRKHLAAVLFVLSACSFSTLSYGLEFFSVEKYSDAVVLPGSSMGAPSGMVASWGSVFGAIGGLTNTPGTDKVQGSSSVGMGFGNPYKGLGATLTLALGSVNLDDDFLERGAFGLSVGKFFPKSQWGIAVGGVNLTGWNTLSTKPKSSAYIAVTKVFPIDEHPIIVHFGVGTNGFADIRSLTPEKESGAFIAVGYYLTPQISVIADYTSNIFSLGTSLVPIDDWPLVFTFGVYDVTTIVPNHNEVSFIGSVAYSYSF